MTGLLALQRWPTTFASFKTSKEPHQFAAAAFSEWECRLDCSFLQH